MVAEVSSCIYIKTLVNTSNTGVDVVNFWMNVMQDLEVEAEDHQGAGSQPRAWGMGATRKHAHSQAFSHTFRCK